MNIYAELTNQSPVGYKSINNGDKFHDIYPKSTLIHSQSQKSLITLGFHNDLPNNWVRPDWVNILCMRNSPFNTISTTVIRNIDILQHLSKATLSTLKKPLFFTPNEVISIHGGNNPDCLHHKPICTGTNIIEFCYFETRTQAFCDEGKRAIQQLDQVLHQVKKPVFLSPGDFISLSNKHSLHAREVLNILDEESHRKRWLIKTFNVNDIYQHKPSMLHGHDYVVNE